MGGKAAGRCVYYRGTARAPETELPVDPELGLWGRESWSGGIAKGVDGRKSGGDNAGGYTKILPFIDSQCCYCWAVICVLLIEKWSCIARSESAEEKRRHKE